MNTLAELLAVATEALLGSALVFFRIGAAFAILPMFGEQSIPSRIRLVLALALTAVVSPILGPELLVIPSTIGYIGALVSEGLIGLIMGLFLRLFVHGLQVAGAIAAQSTSLSQIFGGAGADPQPAVGHILLVAGLALLASMGFHVKLASYFVSSYTIFPFGRLPDAHALAEATTEQVSQVFALGFSLAAPFLIAATIYNIALGAVNRAMPQLMVSFVGAPAITAAGMIILTLSVPFVLAIWVAHIDSFLQAPLGAR